MCGTIKINVTQPSQCSLLSNECVIDTSMPKGTETDVRKTGAQSHLPRYNTDDEKNDENLIIRVIDNDDDIRNDQGNEQIPQEMSPKKTQKILDRNYERLDKMMQVAARKSYKNVSSNDLQALASTILGGDQIQLGKLQVLGRNVTIAMEALDGKKGRDLYTWKLFKGYEVSQDVTNAINAQLDMADAIRFLERKCDPEDEATLSTLGLWRNRCEMRASEISRLAGEMREYIESKDKNRDAFLNQTVKDMLPEMAGKMHGTRDAIQHMKAYVAPLLKTLSDFESTSELASPQQDIERLRGNITLMMNALEHAKKNGIVYGHEYSSEKSLQDPQTVKGDRVMVDGEILDAMMAFLEEKKAKLNHWNLSFTLSMMKKFLAQELRTYRFENLFRTLDQCVQNRDNVKRIAAFKRNLETYKELHDIMLDLCKATTAQEAIDKTKELENKLKTATWTTLKSQNLAKELDMCQKVCKDKETKEAMSLLQYAVKSGTFNFFLEHLSNINEIGLQLILMAKRCKTNLADVLQKSDLAAIFNGSINFSAILEARIHGAVDGDVNPDFAPKNLVSRKKLGSGTMNTVEKCEFRKEDGTIVTGIFKNEISSKSSLKTSALGYLGKYDNSQRNYNLNIACVENAKLFGIENVIAKSSVGVLEGQYGFFMEEAPGDAPDELGKYVFDTTAPRRGELSTKNIWVLDPADKRILMGNLRRELSNLQWLDLINGQGDRHGGNYFVQFKNDLTVKITGIDNDAAFPVARLGVGTFALDGKPEAASFLYDRLSYSIRKIAKNDTDAAEIWHELESLKIIDVKHENEKDSIRYIDMRRIPPNNQQLREVLSYALYFVGVKSLCYPKVIDKRTKDKFLEVYNDPAKMDAWKNNMLKRISLEAVNVMLIRFDEICRYIQNMPQENIIDGDEWHKQDWKPDETKVFRKSDEADYLNKDLFDRDFSFI